MKRRTTAPVAQRMALGWLAATYFSACSGAPPSTPSPVPAQPGIPDRCGEVVPNEPSRARRSVFVGPAKPTTKWVHEIDAAAYGLVADGAGTVFVSLLEGVIAIERDGARRWKHVATTTPQTLPALGPGGALYVEVLSEVYEHGKFGTNGGVQRLDGCGKTAWMIHAPPQNGKTPTIDRRGTVYFAGHDKTFEGPEKVFAVRPDGTIAWSHAVAQGDTVTTPLVVGDDGAVYYGTYKGSIQAVNPDGTGRWSKSALGSLAQQIAIADDGTLYAVSITHVTALDPRGDQRWTIEARDVDPSAPPAIGDGGTLYLGGRLLRAVRPDGTIAWSRALDGFAGSPIIGRDGTLYVATAGNHDIGRVYALDPAGATRWAYYVEPATKLALAGDGLLYVAAGRRIYAIGECTQAECDDDGSKVIAQNHRGPDPRRAPTPPRAPPPRALPPPPVSEPHDGYTIYPGCRASTTAIVSATGADFPWYGDFSSAVKSKDVRERFRDTALGAAGAIRWHASGFGVSCVETRGAFHISVLPGEDVAAAAKRIGEWLVREGLRGEIDLTVEPVPRLL